MTNYSIDDGDGNQLTTGINMRMVAIATAQDMANRLHQSVFVYADGEDEREEVSPITDEMITSLRDDAAAAGDLPLVRDCRIALGEFADSQVSARVARGRAERAIRDARAAGDWYYAVVQDVTEHRATVTSLHASAFDARTKALRLGPSCYWLKSRAPVEVGQRIAHVSGDLAR